MKNRPLRLSDTEAQDDVQKLVADITSTPEKARQFLCQVGILTADGKRSPNYYPDDPDGVLKSLPTDTERLDYLESLDFEEVALTSDGGDVRLHIGFAVSRGGTLREAIDNAMVGNWE